MSDDDVSILDAQASLADIRLRVLNRERVSPDEMRQLLADLTRARDSTARNAKAATAAKAKENRRSATGATTVRKSGPALADLFPKEQ